MNDSEGVENDEGWYRHYMSISAENLAGVYLSASLRENREVSKALEEAAKQRVEELEGYIQL